MKKPGSSLSIVLSLMAILLLSGYGFISSGLKADTRESAPCQPAPGTAVRDTVVVGVLDLKATNVDEGEVEVISERLRFYVGSQSIFELIERAEMFRILEEVGFQQLGACDDEECLVQVGQILGATKMIAGSIGRVGSTYSLHVRIVDIETSRVEHQVFQDVNTVEEILKTATKDVAQELADMFSAPVEPVQTDPIDEPEAVAQPVVTRTETSSTDRWLTKATRLSGRGYLSVSGLVDSLFICIEEIESAGGTFSVVLTYDPVTQQWSQKAAMRNSVGRGTAATGVINGRLYIAGGRTQVSFTKRLRIYDLESNSWSFGASMPTATGEAAAGVIDGRLYVAGGISSIGGTVNILREYNPESNVWSTRASMPTARKNAAAAVIQGRLYVVGGTASNGRILSSLEVYDPTTSVWSSKVAIPTATANACAGVINGMLYIVGGQSASDGAIQLVQIYDPVSESWMSGVALPAARRDAIALSFGGTLYVIGGEGPDGFLNTMDIYIP